MPDAWRISWIGLSIIVALSCRSKGPDDANQPRPPDLGAKALIESERAKDDLWRRAASDDPIDLARLADREGAGGLLDGLDEGGAIGLVALSALPFADDAETALERLGEMVHQMEPAKSGPVIGAIEAIAALPRRPVEPADAPGLRACGQALLVIARNEGVASP